MTRSEDVIREALAAEAAQAVPGSVVLERLRAPRPRRGGLAALVAVGVTAVTAAVAAVVVPLAGARDTTAPVIPAAPAEPLNVVVVGVDGHSYADTVMLVRVDGERVSALSLPRDAWVEIPGHGMGKLNSAYHHGVPTLVDTVEELTGQRVDHHAVVDMAGFERLASAVGGVEVCLRAATSDPFSGADFPAGRQALSGADALAFLRQRRDLPNGDLDRVARQQAFVTSLARQLVTSVLSDPSRRAELTALVQGSVETDPGWNPLAIAAQATGPVRTATIPVDDEDAEAGGGKAVIKVDPAAVRAHAADFFTPAPGATPPATRAPTGDRCVN